MAALMDFTDPTSMLSSLQLPDFYSCSCDGSPADFAGQHTGLDVYDYVPLDERQIYNHSCLDIAAETDVKRPAFQPTKGNAGDLRPDGHEMNGEVVKKRKAEAEFRIGFRTKSEVEIMDDGFKWRKYGKKAVKNSPNPRNYYRCAIPGCGVKKRVERERSDPRYVITIYEGTHNHESPDANRRPFFTYELPHPSPWTSCDARDSDVTSERIAGGSSVKNSRKTANPEEQHRQWPAAVQHEVTVLCENLLPLYPYRRSHGHWPLQRGTARSRFAEEGICPSRCCFIRRARRPEGGDRAGPRS
ncbi:hypothetical protein HPP92_021292 [Vanilla planifolia]|uniref:WRKY domain-containing protein n=1 Tax=Vanilla planifolia TaxID=51239 RepID=A0A835PYF5_VANPL|nr:hypothetical protein HPP92_021292 [Vanilla planifolia]